jgi:hypothetical protein
MRTLLMTALYSASLLTAGQQMNVAVCNLGDVRESVVTGAKAETELIYRSASRSMESPCSVLSPV